MHLHDMNALYPHSLVSLDDDDDDDDIWPCAKSHCIYWCFVLVLRLY